MRWIGFVLFVLPAGCQRGAGAPAGPPPKVQIDPQSVTTVAAGEIEDGPLVSGVLRPAIEAATRAEVSGTVLEAPPEPGTTVKQGQVLVRFDPSALTEAHRSAVSALRSAKLAEELARRDAERFDRLARAGAIAPREAETASRALVAAGAAVADAAARVSSARSALDRATGRSPFAGVISVRSVKAGDVVTPGTALFTVIDPRTMRLEAAVPADRIGEIQAGQRVDFQVTGYGPRRFEGKIDRISPVTDAATGQVGVTAVLGNESGTLIGGLHAEGRVLTRKASGLIVPLAAIDRRRLSPEVLRLKGGTIERVPVEIGLTDEIGERAIVTSGLAAGDVLLLGAAQEIAPGTPVEVTGASASAAPEAR